MNLLELICQPTDNMPAYVLAWAAEQGFDEVITDGLNYVFCIPKDPHPVCLVGHMDTVGNRNNIELLTNTNILWNKNGVLGADDRSGIYIMVEVYRRLEKKPYMLFTNFEEGGCKGVRQFVKDKVFEPYQDGVYAFFEWDRRGILDYVTYIDAEGGFNEHMLVHGYNHVHGSMSDVKVLSEAYNIAHANCSAGYYNEHSAAERLVTGALPLIIDFGTAAVAGIDRLYKTKPKPKPVYDKWRGGTSYSRGYLWDERTECYICGCATYAGGGVCYPCMRKLEAKVGKLDATDLMYLESVSIYTDGFKDVNDAASSITLYRKGEIPDPDMTEDAIDRLSRSEYTLEDIEALATSVLIGEPLPITKDNPPQCCDVCGAVRKVYAVMDHIIDADPSLQLAFCRDCLQRSIVVGVGRLHAMSKPSEGCWREKR